MTFLKKIIFNTVPITLSFKKKSNNNSIILQPFFGTAPTSTISKYRMAFSILTLVRKGVTTSSRICTIHPPGTGSPLPEDLINRKHRV